MIWFDLIWFDSDASIRFLLWSLFSYCSFVCAFFFLFQILYITVEPTVYCNDNDDVFFLLLVNCELIIIYLISTSIHASLIWYLNCPWLFYFINSPSVEVFMSDITGVAKHDAVIDLVMHRTSKRIVNEWFYCTVLYYCILSTYCTIAHSCYFDSVD